MQTLETKLEAQSTARLQSESATLCVVDLRKGFLSSNGKRLEVLRGVTFEVESGEILAITGASGSGKSTLLHLLGALEEPDHGSISLEKTHFARLKADELAELRQGSIGFVFQFHYLLSDLTAAENVGLPLQISRENPASIGAKVTELLTKMGLGDRAQHPVAHLSGGEQQRIALARALITAPRLLLADEPTGNLDGNIGDEIGKTLVNYVREQNAIAIVATHNEKLARQCDRVSVLEDGRLHSV